LTTKREGRSVPTTICQLLIGLGMGGAEVLAARMARRLRDRFRFVFACLDEQGVLGGELRAEGFPVHVLGRRAGVDWRCCRRLAALVKSERVTVVHAHQYTPFFYATASRLPRRCPPVAFTEHGRWFPDFPRPKRIVANRMLLGPRDRVIGVGESVRQSLIRNEGINSRRVEVIYNGVNLEAYSAQPPSPMEIAEARREMGVGEADFVVIQVARLDHLKDHVTAIETFNRVVAQCPGAKLVLVGEGPERAKIEEAVQRLDLGCSVRMIGLRQDVPRLIRAADLFLLTSISEGIPLTLIEAMAARVPVVSTRVGGVVEVVEEDRNGLLAASGDAPALAKHVLRLAGNPALRREFGERGRLRAEAMFSETRMIDQYERLYIDMIGPR
jgi:L-malate glycosyltransferase